MSHIEIKGTVVKSLPGRSFEVEITVGQTVRNIIGALKGKMYMNKISVVPGDEVKVELSPYDLSKGFISERIDNKVKV